MSNKQIETKFPMWMWMWMDDIFLFCFLVHTQAMFDSPSTAEERRKIMLRSKLFENGLKWNRSFNSNFSRRFIKIRNLPFKSRSDAHKIYNFSNFCAVCFRFLCTLFGKMSIASDDTHIKSFLKQKKLLRIALHTEPLKTESLFWAHFVGSLNFSTVVINYS